MAEQRVPVVEEQVRIDKRLVETGVVRIRTAIKEREELLSETLTHEEVSIDRVSMNVEVDAMPDVRQEGDVTIIPVVEERIVVVKRLVLTEELRVTRKAVQEITDIPVTLRSTEVSVQREASSSTQHIAKPDESGESK